MDKNQKQSPDLRFVGIDLGNSAARLAKTAYDSEAAEFQDPEIRTFETSTSIPSRIVTVAGESRTITKRRDLQSKIGRPDGMQAIEKDFVWQLGIDPADLTARECIRAMAERLYKETRGRVANFDASNYLVSTSIPSDWSLDSAAAHVLQAMLHEAGFPAVELVHDAIAAVTYHLLTEQAKYRLPYYQDRLQSWLVIDVGGKSTRISRLEKSPFSSEIAVRGVLRFDWGGHLIDEKLFQDYLLPTYWHSAELPSETQKALLLELICELKEKFSGQVKRSGQTSINFQFEGIRDPVELSREIFESEMVCQSVIQQFQQLLEDPRLIEDAEFRGFEHVILIGGGANWYFVQSAVQSTWPWCTVYAQDPDLTVAKGLAWFATGSTPQDTLPDEPIIDVSKPGSTLQSVVEEKTLPTITANVNTNGRGGPGKSYPVVGHLDLGQQSAVYGRNDSSTWWYIQNPIKPAEYFWVNAETTQVSGDLSAVPVEKPPAAGSPSAKKAIANKHGQSRQLIYRCALIGSVIALMLSPIPGASAPFLMGLEIYMLLKIAKDYYGLKTSSQTVVLLIVGLLVISTVLTLLVSEVIAIIFLVVGWLIKMVVAGLVIWGLGEAAIIGLDKISEIR